LIIKGINMPIPVLAALAGGGLAGAAGSLFGGGDDNKGYEEALERYQQYMNRAVGEFQKSQATGRGDIERYYRTGLGFTEPYREAGKTALGDYMASLGERGGAAQGSILDKFRTSPGYKFALQQGTQAMERGAAARGGLLSGGEQKELTRYGTGLADQEYGGYQSRLAELAGMGQQAATGAQQAAIGTGGALAGLGVQYSGLLGQAYGQMGQAASEARLAEMQAAEQRRAEFAKMFGQIGGAALGAYGKGVAPGGAFA